MCCRQSSLPETGATQEIPFQVLFYQAVVLTDTSSGKYILPCWLMDKLFPTSSPKICRVLSGAVKPWHKPCCSPIVLSHFSLTHLVHVKNVFLQSAYKLQECQLRPLQLSPIAVLVWVLTADYMYNHQKNRWYEIPVNIFNNSPQSSHLNQKNK